MSVSSPQLLVASYCPTYLYLLLDCAIAWSTVLIFDIIVFALTLRLRLRRGRSAQNGLFSLMVRDGERPIEFSPDVADVEGCCRDSVLRVRQGSFNMYLCTEVGLSILSVLYTIDIVTFLVRFHSLTVTFLHRDVNRYRQQAYALPLLFRLSYTCSVTLHFQSVWKGIIVVYTNVYVEAVSLLSLS